jgi:hypothetical protein
MALFFRAKAPPPPPPENLQSIAKPLPDPPWDEDHPAAKVMKQDAPILKKLAKSPVSHVTSTNAINMGDETFGEALWAQLTNKHPDDALFVVNRETGEEYKVMEFDVPTKRVVLSGANGLSMTVMLTIRDNTKYRPVWRKTS